jgi:hypothetical protein
VPGTGIKAFNFLVVKIRHHPKLEIG